MTADHGNAPDLDLLADYAAGVLDGTAEGAAVAERVAGDPAWAALYAALVRADDAVRADLAGLPPEPIPSDVAARLDGALAAERSRVETETLADAAPVVPLRRRRPGRMVGGAVAAGVAVLAAGAIGLQVFSSNQSGGNETSAASDAGTASRELSESTRGVPPKAAPGAQPDAAAGGVASGTDYRRETLATQINSLVAAKARLAPNSADQAAAVPPALSRLAQPAALRECLTALGATGQPRTVDYARYDGAPAVVIVLPTASTETVDVAVVGPACGVSGSDTRLRTTLRL